MDKPTYVKCSNCGISFKASAGNALCLCSACGPKTKIAITDKAKSARAVASMFGGTALTGTAKQKNWAEEIRAKMLAAMTEDQAILVCKHDSLFTTAKFWIENRTKDGRQIGEFAAKLADIRAEHVTARTENNAEKIEATAAEYNQLTKEWFGA